MLIRLFSRLIPKCIFQHWPKIIIAEENFKILEVVPRTCKDTGDSTDRPVILNAINIPKRGTIQNSRTNRVAGSIIAWS